MKADEAPCCVPMDPHDRQPSRRGLVVDRTTILPVLRRTDRTQVVVKNRKVGSVSVCLVVAFSTSILCAQRPIVCEAESANHRYIVRAALCVDIERVTGQEGGEYEYQCIDKASGRVMWTRRQETGAVDRVDNITGEHKRIGKEGRPREIFISDAMVVVVRTSSDQIIVFGKGGEKKCALELFPDVVSKDEAKRFTKYTSEGSQWARLSLWYFIDSGGRHVFVIRPWWGRRTFLDLDKGEVAKADDVLIKSAIDYESEYVMTELERGVRTREEWEKTSIEEWKKGQVVTSWKTVEPVLAAACLAGQMQIRKSLSLLRNLEATKYVGCEGGGVLSLDEQFEGEVDPHSCRMFTLRQAVQLSLRRLGEVPREVGAVELMLRFDSDEKRSHWYASRPLKVPRQGNVGAVRKGMKAEDVLGLIGGPDFVSWEQDCGVWEYDMDSDPPASLVLRWGVREVVDVQQVSPPFWKNGVTRDWQVVSPGSPKLKETKPLQ